MGEFIFIISSLNHALNVEDPEIVGELIHCLYILGYQMNDEVINKAIPKLRDLFIRSLEFLINCEGSFKECGMWTDKASVAYARYHAAWCGIVGLMPHFSNEPPVAFVGNLADVEPHFI